MTKEKFFETNIVPRLAEIISCKEALYFSKKSIDYFLETGLAIRCENGLIISSKDYELTVDLFSFRLVKIKKDTEVLYDEKNRTNQILTVKMFDIS